MAPVDLADTANILHASEARLRVREVTGFLALQALLARFTYKPGYKLELIHGDQPYSFLTLALRVPTRDVTKPDHPPTTFTFATSCSTSMLMKLDEKEFMWRVRVFIEDWERHECHEWLKFDGVCVVDPHPIGPDGKAGIA